PRRGRALPLHVVELPAHLLDLLADHPSVRLELCLTWSTCPNSAARPRQVRPHARQPWQVVLELSQLDLEPSFVRARVSGEDVDDQRGPIGDLAIQQTLE